MHQLFALFLFVAICVQYTLTEKILAPDEPLNNESILPGESQLYTLSDLEANSHYEVRISYPATSPTDFRVAFVPSSGRKRNLLNTEKIMFKTDEHGAILGEQRSGEHYQIQVTASYDGVSVIPDADKRPVIYNIVLETLFHGAPYDVFTIGIIVAVSVILIVTIFIPQLFPFLSVGAQTNKRN